jgi:hypothetical protein
MDSGFPGFIGAAWEAFYGAAAEIVLSVEIGARPWVWIGYLVSGGGVASSLAEPPWKCPRRVHVHNVRFS